MCAQGNRVSFLWKADGGGALGRSSWNKIHLGVPGSPQLLAPAEKRAAEGWPQIEILFCFPSIVL